MSEGYARRITLTRTGSGYTYAVYIGSGLRPTGRRLTETGTIEHYDLTQAPRDERGGVDVYAR